MTRGLKMFGALAIAAIAVTGCKSDDGGDMATDSAAMGAINDVYDEDPNRELDEIRISVDTDAGTYKVLSPESSKE